jgi:galactokinase
LFIAIIGGVREFAVRAPGRVNLIGEHTDYNQGFVLPAAIDRELRMVGERTADHMVEIRSELNGETASFALDDIGPARGQWIDYVAGVAHELQAAGVGIGGFRGRLSGNLPAQAGLSSSAALELASAWALADASGIDRLELAGLCQRAENAYVGVNSGLMDQFAVSCGVAGHALLLDCRSREYRAVPIPADLELVVVDTGAQRRLVGSEYNERRAECERGVAILAGKGEAVESLRDADTAMLDRWAADLGELTRRRCQHVVAENERTLAAVNALEGGDRHALRALFGASHASLRDLYEVSSAELDLAVEVAMVTPGVVAARMTGAGFGGCTVNLVERGAAGRLREAIERDYVPRTGLAARVFAVEAAGGAGPAADGTVASSAG